MSDIPSDLFAASPVHDGDDLAASGAGRDPWSGVAAAYRTMGVAEMARRRDEIQRLLEQDGVTYNVSTDGHHHRTWTLDPIPYLVPGDEWARIDRGMIQRAELLDLVLRDLYGERRLLRSGLLPPEMILADPEFARPCDGITIPGEKQLVVFGADLARSADGGWTTLGHRTQTPSGASYALENRRVLSRVFPQLFRATGVQRLTPFVEALRLALLAAAPVGVDDPSIAVLSPGALSETAFEHAAIAAQLGFPLVQGSDFECRGGRVGLRTVSGWVPVHVILRRVDTSFCDPLALRSGSTLGIPGLVDACRAGTVSVVNTLGSGILENAGLAGLMATLSTHLLGEDLILDPVPSWWCGDGSGRSHVLANLETLIVRPLSRSTLGHAIDTTRASATELDELRRRILDRPGQWVGQERVVPGTAPVFTDGGIEHRAAVLRTFAIAHAGSYVAMPGGLARTATSDPTMPITNRLGSGSKDTWVLSSDSQPRRDVWLSEPGIAAHTPVDALPARAAEHLFWLGRYAERAESTIRLIRTINARRDEFDQSAPGPGRASLTVLLEALTRITGTYPGFVGDDAARLFDDPTAELFALVVDDRRPGTVAHAIRHMFEAIDVVRDQLSVDTWLVVGSMQRELQRLEQHVDGDTTSDRDEATTTVLNALLHGLLSLSGLASESMVRDLGWQFMETGRRIERALHVTSMVGSALCAERSAAVESLVVDSVLAAGESIITSRRRFRAHALTSTTIGLLFDDGGNPRSVRFQLDRLAESLAVLYHDLDGTAPATPALLRQARALIDATDPSSLATVDDNGYRPQLDLFVSTIQSDLRGIAEGIESHWFTRFHAQHALIGPNAVTRPFQATPGDVDVIYEVSHNTRYDYDAPVVASFAELRQLPDDLDGQHCIERSIASDPVPEHHREHRDFFGNLTATVVIREAHTQLVMASSCVIDTGGRPTKFAPDGQRPWIDYTARAAGSDDLLVVEFSLDSSRVTRSERLAEYARPSFGDGTSLADGALSLCSRIHRDFMFDADATKVDTPLEDVLDIRRGVCQDFAHVMIGALRSLGLAACYVSGYLETEPPPGKPRLAGVDRSHAWVGVYVGGGRWIGVDPTNDQIAGTRYITSARGRDYSDVPPLRGVIFTDAERSTLTVSVDVAAQSPARVLPQHG